MPAICGRATARHVHLGTLCCQCTSDQMSPCCAGDMGDKYVDIKDAKFRPRSANSNGGQYVDLEKAKFRPKEAPVVSAATLSSGASSMSYFNGPGAPTVDPYGPPSLPIKSPAPPMDHGRGGFSGDGERGGHGGGSLFSSRRSWLPWVAGGLVLLLLLGIGLGVGLGVGLKKDSSSPPPVAPCGGTVMDKNGTTVQLPPCPALAADGQPAEAPGGDIATAPAGPPTQMPTSQPTQMPSSQQPTQVPSSEPTQPLPTQQPTLDPAVAANAATPTLQSMVPTTASPSSGLTTTQTIPQIGKVQHD